MISLQTARKLKEAGLSWQPALNDFFAIPDREMDDQIFVISEVQVTVEVMQELQVLTFQGASEWALDSLVMSESVWLPSEEQLRQMLEATLLKVGRPEVRLSGGLGGYHCDIQFGGQALSFEAKDASEAYAAALHHVLRWKP
jgi:hypothetical protein